MAKDGRLPATKLEELAKLDSVLRESARLNGVLSGKLTTSTTASPRLLIANRCPPKTIVTLGRVLQKPHKFSIVGRRAKVAPRGGCAVDAGRYARDHV